MAQIFLGSFLNGRSTEEEVEGKAGQMPTFKYRRKRTYYIIADNATENEDDILANANIPDLGNTSVLGFPVKTRGAKESEYVIHPVTGVPTTLWEVEISSDSTLSLTFPGGTVTPPLELPPKYKWTQKEREVDFSYDVVTGAPLQNVNGEPIFRTRKILYPVLTITRYESYFQDLSTLQKTYGNTLNLEPFGPFPKGVCLMNPIQAEEEVIQLDDQGMPDATVTFLKVTYEIDCLVNDYYEGDTTSPWSVWELNQGYYVRPAPGQPPQLNIWDGNKTRINLALNGTALPLDAEPIWLEFNEFKYADWTPLELTANPEEPEEPEPDP